MRAPFASAGGVKHALGVTMSVLVASASLPRENVRRW
jgi:hypothetical protein